MAVLLAIENLYLRETTSEILKSRDVRVGWVKNIARFRELMQSTDQALNVAVSSDFEGLSERGSIIYLESEIKSGRIKVLMIGEPPKELEGLVIKAPPDVTPSKLASALYALEFKYASLSPQAPPADDVTIPHEPRKVREELNKVKRGYAEKPVTEEKISLSGAPLQEEIIAPKPDFETISDSIVGKIGVKQVNEEEYAKSLDERKRREEEIARKKREESERRRKEMLEKARKPKYHDPNAPPEPIELEGLDFGGDDQADFVGGNEMYLDTFDDPFSGSRVERAAPKKPESWGGKDKSIQSPKIAPLPPDPEPEPELELESYSPPPQARNLPDPWEGKERQCKTCGAERKNPKIPFCTICGNAFKDSKKR
ncbi:MAG: hypothetical protein Kow0090_00220 [Myxococcota bacterium]